MQLNSIAEFCDNTGMTINQSKTEIIVFRNGGSLRSYERWSYKGSPVNTTSCYKYVGLLFTPNLSWSKSKAKLAAQTTTSIFSH